jgi:UDP-glucuronate 4-epimerase
MVVSCRRQVAPPDLPPGVVSLHKRPEGHHDRRKELRIVLTGAAGFIGASVAAELLSRGHDVAALDNFDETYPAAFKHARIERLSLNPRFTFAVGDIRDSADVKTVFDPGPDAVVHLAAQGGLRRSIEDPAAFVSSNIGGFTNVIAAAANAQVRNFVYASSGAVYGGTATLPFREDDPAVWPLSLYGSTKRSDELIAFTYARYYGLRCTGLRFFTVYGPDGRPDMAVYNFTKNIYEGSPIQVHGHGRMVRDFVYVDDVAHCVVLAAEDQAEFETTRIGEGPATAVAEAPWRVLNVATGKQVSVLDIVRQVETAVGHDAEMKFVDALRPEVTESRADLTALENALGFVPAVTIDVGIPRAVSWYLDYLKNHPG